MSGPEVLHAGTPTTLAVTVFSDFPSKVTAELAHGDTRVTQTESFQGGDAIPGSITQNSLLNLTVRGYRNDALIFTNTTNLIFNLKNVSTFIQTDRSRYQPGDTVKLRIVSLQLDSSPYKGKMTLLCHTQDPSGNIVNSWESAGNLGIVLQEFNLSQSVPLGVWAITTTVNVGWIFFLFLNYLFMSLFELNIKIVHWHLWWSSADYYSRHVPFLLKIQARFESSEKTLSVYKSYSSPSGSYIQISPNDTLSNRLLWDIMDYFLNIFEKAYDQYASLLLCFQVSSRGQVVAAGTKNSSFFSLTPRVSWSPKACVTVYSVLPDGEVTSDTAHITINQHNYVSLNWSSDKAQPGEQVSLTVTGPQPDSQIGIVVMGAYDEGPDDVLDLKVEEFTAFFFISISNQTWTSGRITVPDGVTSLRAVAFIMSDNVGLGFTPVPQKLTVSKDFSLSLNVPPYLIRGEEIVFVLENRTGGSVINAHKLDIGSHASASAMFPIRPVTLGEMEISVDAISAGASDSLLWRVLVKAEGVEQIFSETLFLELEPENRNNSTSISFSFPADVVPGSKRAHVALVGDILALSIGNLDSLVQVPLGCGEQNMIHFAPSVYVLQYLEKSTLDSKEIRSRALASMMEGYQRQLSYQRDDGSFSAFGDSDTSGSTWLTAFVLRCFLQAQPHMQIDQSVLTRAMTWLLKHQGPQGEFTEVGRLIHTEMQGGLDKGPVALTAYVLIALLEDEMYTGNVSLAQNYLEKKVFIGVVSNYTLSLVTYALTLANSPVAAIALAELNRRADYRDGVMVWRSTADLDSPDGPLRSAQIEVASYVLLTLFRYGSFVEGITLFKWLSKQRNYLGGYGTTQNIFLLKHGSTQMNIFYNLGNAAFSQSHTPDQEAFSLGVDATVERDSNHMLLSICTSQMIPRTGMAIVDVGMLSGFSLSPEAAATTDLIRKVEILPEKVILYLDSVSSEVCIKLPVIRHYKVACVQDAMVEVYDYYEPSEATKTYNSDVLHNMDSCFFCGASCDLCRAGISIIASHSVSTTTYSFIFLFLGVTAFFIVV
uniref:CD109 molecule n=1 Tax=Mastacembelus armatus TaxID=205130 RepID=A0A3Q3LTU4_9TELE